MSTPEQNTTLSTRDLVQLLPELRKQLADAEQRAQDALAEVESLRKIVSGLEELAGAGSPRPAQLLLESPRASHQLDSESDPGPRGQEAVRQVLAGNPDKTWTLSEIYRAIQARGWINPDAKTPQAAVRAATQRLASTGAARKVGAGRYRYSPDGDSQAG